MKNLPRLSLKRKEDEVAASAEDLALSQEGREIVDEIDELADEAWEEQRTIVPALAAKPDEIKAKKIKRIANAFFISAIALCLLLSMVFILNSFSGGLFGLRFFVEPTDAMAPAIRRGSLLVTVNRRPERINSGDVITYNALPHEPESRLTRIVETRTGSEGNHRFRTRRPGASLPDSIVIHSTSVLGVAVAAIPYAGFVIAFLRMHAIGIAFIAAAMCAAAVLLRKWLKPPAEPGASRLAKWRLQRKERKDAENQPLL